MRVNWKQIESTYALSASVSVSRANTIYQTGKAHNSLMQQVQDSAYYEQRESRCSGSLLDNRSINPLEIWLCLAQTGQLTRETNLLVVTHNL